ncbi:MAG: NifB/NifX family molybdenum-iron cluster-binding protein [bacterium]
MRLFISADSDDMSGKIDSSFGRCSFFLLYETEDDSFEFVRNPHQDSQTSVGSSVAQSAIEYKVKAVIAVNPGPRAFKLLQNTNIQIYHVPENTSLKAVISSFEKNELLPLENYLPYHIS